MFENDAAYYDNRMTRTFRTLAWLALFAIAAATLSPLGLRPRLSMTSVSIEHVTAYTAIGALFALAYPKQIWLAAIVVLVAVFAFEWVQTLTPDRHGRLMDALQKAGGSAIGLGLGWLCLNVPWLRSR
jgi:cytochrome c oxidase assembly factor CtaG